MYICIYLSKFYLNTEERQTLKHVSFPCSTNRVQKSVSFEWGMNIFRITADCFSIQRTQNIYF